MWQEQIRRYILPGSIEKDPGFRQEIERLSHLGLRVVGAVEIVVPAFMALAYVLLHPDPELIPLRLKQAGWIILLGTVTLAISRLKGVHRYARRIAVLSGLAAAAILVSSLTVM